MVMTTIKRLLQDPGWWVTAVFVGIGVSVIGAFIKDAIANALARFSTTFREWRRRRRLVYLRSVEDLARDSHLILDTGLRAVAMLVVWALSLTAMMDFYILIRITGASGFPIVALFCVGLFSFLPYFLAIRFLGLWRNALRIYKKKNLS